jgi:Fis family transcriptional regulator
MEATTLTPLHQLLKPALEAYFVELDGAIIGNIYNLVIGEVEKPLLEFIIGRAKNQNQAAEWLGISRNTLRKLLYKHELLLPVKKK